MSGQGNNGVGAVLGVTTTATGAATLAQTGNGWIAATLVGAAIISASIVIMMARVK